MKITVMDRAGSFVDVISVTEEFWNDELPKFLVESGYMEEGQKLDEEETLDGFLICWCQYDLDTIHYAVCDESCDFVVNELTPDDFGH